MCHVGRSKKKFAQRKKSDFFEQRMTSFSMPRGIEARLAQDAAKGFEYVRAFSRVVFLHSRGSYFSSSRMEGRISLVASSVEADKRQH